MFKFLESDKMFQDIQSAEQQAEAQVMSQLSVDRENSVEDQAPRGFVKLKLEKKKFDEINKDVLKLINQINH